MGYRHLTDFEVQEALDGTLRRERPLLQLHLDRCDLCSLRFADYRKVVGSISSVHVNDISPESVDGIMRTIESSAVHHEKHETLVTTLGWIGAGLTAAASIVWVIARTDFPNGIRELAMSYVQTASTQTDKILPLLSNNMLAFAGVAALAVMMAVDSVIRRRVTGVNLFSV